MAERPILFSAPMVRAILEGRKSQTRRVVKVTGEPINAFPDPGGSVFSKGGYLKALYEESGDELLRRIYCPYGQPGDRLWVKEAITRAVSYSKHDRATFVADGVTTKLDAWPWKMKTLPGMFLPRGLSRITLEVVSVRVERLQDITEEDARAEGVEAVYDPEGDCWTDGKHRTAFELLWGQINGFDGERRARATWKSNPFVWVVEFKRIAQEARAA